MLAVLLAFAAAAEDMRPSRSVPSRFMGSVYYNDCVAYNFNFETGDLDLYNNRGSGKLLSVTLVMPAKGARRSRPAEGEYILGRQDSLAAGRLDYYESAAAYYSSDYDTPDRLSAFQECRLVLRSLKGNRCDVTINYRLTNGEQGEAHWQGKLGFDFDARKQQFKFQPKQPRISNWTLTKAELEIDEATAYGSRRAVLRYECGDIKGYTMLYLPEEGIEGRYEMRYGKRPYSAECSRGGFDDLGYFTTARYGAIEDEFNQIIYFPSAGTIDITAGGLHFEFTTRDGSTVRGTYRDPVTIKR